MGSLSIPYVLPAIQDPELRLRKYANWLVALSERRRRAVEVSALPCELTIDPATLCQLSCPYCATGRGTMQRSRGTLGIELHRQLLDELADSAFLVWYFNTGEPLLHRQLPALVAQTRGSEIHSIVSTNLSLTLVQFRPFYGPR